MILIEIISGIIFNIIKQSSYRLNWFLNEIHWGSVIKAIIYLSLILALFFLYLIFCTNIREQQEIKLKRKHIIHLKNNSNMPMRYYLRFINPNPALKTELLYGKFPMIQVWQKTESRQIEKDEQPVNHINEPVGNTKNNKTEDTKKEFSIDPYQTVKEKAGKIGNKAGQLSRLLGSIGALLPDKWSKYFKEKQESAQNFQRNIIEKGNTPERIKKQTESIRNQTKSFVGGSKPASSLQFDKKEDKKQNLFDSNEMKRIPPSSVRGEFFSQSPVVETGDTLDITVSIQKIKPGHENKTEGYTVEIRQKPEKEMDIHTPTMYVNGIACFEPNTQIENVMVWLKLIGGLVVTMLIIITAGMILY